MPGARSQWSGDIVRSGKDVAVLRISLLRAPWYPTPKPFLVRIHAHDMTGRRLPLHLGRIIVERQEW
jgi:hypothetical protein